MMEKDYVEFSGGKRANIIPSSWQDGVWIGVGKDESCVFEANWGELVSLAHQILEHDKKLKSK